MPMDHGTPVFSQSQGLMAITAVERSEKITDILVNAHGNNPNQITAASNIAIFYR